MRKLILYILTIIFSHNLHNLNAEIINTTAILDSAKAYNNSGADAYILGDYDLAGKYFRKSLDLKLKIFNHDSEPIGNSINNLALVYYKYWQFDSAFILLKEAEKIFKKTNAPINKIANTYNNMGKIKKYLGDFTTAELYYKKSLEILAKKQDSASVLRKVELYTLLNLLDIQQKDFLSALRYLKLALSDIEKLDDYTKISLFRRLAYNFFLLDDSDNCFKYMDKALLTARKKKSTKEYNLMNLYRDYGEYHTGFGNYEVAERYFNLSYDILKLHPKLIDMKAILEEYRAILEHKKGNYQKSLKYIQEALDYYANNEEIFLSFSNLKAKDIKAKMPVLKLLQLKSDNLIALYRKENDVQCLISGIETSELAIQLLNEMRLGFQSYESKVFVTENEHNIYNTALKFAVLSYNNTDNPEYLNKAFTFTEQGKSAILLSSLRESEAMSYGGIPDSLVHKEKILNREITFYKEQIYEEGKYENPDSLKINTWRNNLIESTEEYNAFTKYIERKYEKYYQLKHNTSVVTLKGIQKHLGRNTTLIEFDLQDTALYTYVIDHNNISLQTISINSKLNTQIDNYLRFFKNFDFFSQNQENINDFMNESYQLYVKLIEPLLDIISTKNIVFITDGKLAYIPFESLVTNYDSTKMNNSFANTEFLLYRYNIYYSYSSTLLKEASNRSSKARNAKLLAVAPEYTSDDAIAFHFNTFNPRQQYRKDLNPIPGALEEVRAISKLLAGDTLIGSNATESNFINYASDFDLLHLAMHTVIDNSNPMYSKLIFSPENDSLYDGYLNTNELFGLTLNSRLTVLSSCSTGEGKINKGEGVISLARGFIYAGSPSLVMTLWEVDDKSGVTLMKYFYKNLLKGQCKSTAMRNAKIAYLKNSPLQKTHPFFWSTYICLGNDAPIFRNRFINVYAIIGLVLVTFIGIFWYFKIKGRN